MNDLRLIHIRSLAELRAAENLWDDLWWRSDVTLPTARAELVAQWAEHFVPRAAFHGLAVESQGRWVAAMPLVHAWRCRWLSTAALTGNEWSPNGELLLDHAEEGDSALDVLVAGLRELGWPLVWLHVPLHAPRWRAFQAALGRAAMPSDSRPQWRVPTIEIASDWQTCQQLWSKKHRDQMLKADRRLAEQGDVQFQVYSHPEPEQVDSLVRQAFEVEDRSWKGEAGTSVLRTPGMFDFFLGQAKQLSGWGQLELALLKLNGRPISFVYGSSAKGVSHWLKLGYDPQYRCSAPGLLVQFHILERLHQLGGHLSVDCVGPLTDALAKWKPSTYAVGRLIVAPRRWSGRLALWAGKRWWPRIRGWLGSGGAVPPEANGSSGSSAAAVGDTAASHSADCTVS